MSYKAQELKRFDIKEDKKYRMIASTQNLIDAVVKCARRRRWRRCRKRQD